MSGPAILDRRLVFVLGKGGVGKSTVAAALGLLGARAGKRTLLIEVASQDRLSRLFTEQKVEFEVEMPLAPGLWGLSVDVEKGIEEYLTLQLKVRPLVELLVRSRAFHSFAAAAPGLAELVTLGKIWSLATEVTDGAPVWDLLVVDCPATGHGIALLEVAGRVTELAATGPIRDQSARIQEVVTHPAATGVVVVARPEELPVAEAIEAVAALRERGLPVAAVVMNDVADRRFGPEDGPVLARALAAARAEADPDQVAALEVAAALLHREEREQAHSDHLLDAVDLPVAEAPEVVRPRMDLEGIGLVADALAGSEAIVPVRPEATVA